MRLKMFGFSCAVVAAMCLTAAPATAQGRGHGNDKAKDNDHHGSVDKGRDNDHDSADRGDDNDHHASVDRRPDMPPGLAKKGGLPPGLAKKGGLPPGQARHRYQPDEGVSTLRNVLAQHGYTVVRTSDNGTSRNVYYRYRNGSLHRAVVSPGTNQLAFSNVPSSVLRDLRSMLHY